MWATSRWNKGCLFFVAFPPTPWPSLPPHTHTISRMKDRLCHNFRWGSLQVIVGFKFCLIQHYVTVPHVDYFYQNQFGGGERQLISWILKVQSTLPLVRSVTLGMSLHISKLLFPRSKNRDNNPCSAHILNLL